MLTEDQKKKAGFVTDYIRPMLMAVNPNIADVVYYATPYSEKIEISHHSGMMFCVNVSMDSNRAMVVDVARLYLDRY